jgi:PAS domain-containing protein
MLARAGLRGDSRGQPVVVRGSRLDDDHVLVRDDIYGSRFPAVVSVTALRDAQETSCAGHTAAEVMNKITPADISDPQELIARAKALSIEIGTTITPGFEALVFKASRGIEDIYELTYIRNDGSRFPAVVSVTALRDAQDTIIGYLLIGTDNTARKLVEAAQKKLDQRLRDQQFYTRSLIESNIDALMTTDPSGIITDVNKGGAHRLHTRRADRRAVQELLHRSGAGRSGDQARAERKEGH